MTKSNFFCVLWQKIKIKFNARDILNGNLHIRILYPNLLWNFRNSEKTHIWVSCPSCMKNCLWEDRQARITTSFKKQLFSIKWNTDIKEICIVSFKNDQMSHLQSEEVVLYLSALIFLWNFSDSSLLYSVVSAQNPNL